MSAKVSLIHTRILNPNFYFPQDCFIKPVRPAAKRRVTITNRLGPARRRVKTCRQKCARARPDKYSITACA